MDWGKRLATTCQCSKQPLWWAKSPLLGTIKREDHLRISFTSFIKSRLWPMIGHYPFIANDNGWVIRRMPGQMADGDTVTLETKVKMWSTQVMLTVTASSWELPEYCEVRRLINLIIRSLLLMAPSVSVVSPRVTGGHLARPVASNVSQSVNELASSAPTFRRAKLDNLKKNIKQAKNALNLTV